MPNQPTESVISTLADDAKALLSATADVAGEKVSEARKRLTAALESGQHLFVKVKDQAVAGAKVTDEAVHKHPYMAIGIAFGVGTLLGVLVSRRWTRSRD